MDITRPASYRFTKHLIVAHLLYDRLPALGLTDVNAVIGQFYNEMNDVYTLHGRFVEFSDRLDVHEREWTTQRKNQLLRAFEAQYPHTIGYDNLETNWPQRVKVWYPPEYVITGMRVVNMSYISQGVRPSAVVDMIKRETVIYMNGSEQTRMYNAITYYVRFFTVESCVLTIYTTHGVCTLYCHMAFHLLTVHFPAVGLVDVNTVIARYYHELLMADVHTLHGFSVVVTDDKVCTWTPWRINRFLRAFEEQHPNMIANTRSHAFDRRFTKNLHLIPAHDVHNYQFDIAYAYRHEGKWIIGMRLVKIEEPDKRRRAYMGDDYVVKFDL